jgi:D-alanine-D-alanine ligase
MSDAQRIGVLMGGYGEEREVSLRSGEAMAAALERRGHGVIRLVADENLDSLLRGAPIDVVVLALHGRLGEDGQVQGLLEVMGIPYTGSGVLSSALAMNKVYAKKVFRQHNLPTPTGYVVTGDEVAAAPHLHTALGFPCIVKPASSGSSMGVSLVERADQLESAVVLACQFGGEALVERFVQGRDVSVAVLDDEVLGSCEVAHEGPRFDSGAKPPHFSRTQVANLEQLALAATRALGCRGASLVDFVVPDVGNEVVLEVNTLPGMTPQSLFPKIAEAKGWSFEEVVERIAFGATLDAIIRRDERPGRRRRSPLSGVGATQNFGGRPQFH